MSLLATLGQLALTFLGLVILAIPLYITIGLLGGRRSIITVIIVNLLTGFLAYSLQATYPVWGWLLAFVLSLWLYREIFRLKWWKALLAYFLQFVILLIFWFILGAVLLAIGLTGLVVGTPPLPPPFG